MLIWNAPKLKLDAIILVTFNLNPYSKWKIFLLSSYQRVKIGVTVRKRGQGHGRVINDTLCLSLTSQRVLSFLQGDKPPS